MQEKFLLSDVGIVIFMFGNKLENGAVIDCTGYMSKDIWDKVMTEPQKYYGTNEKLIKSIEKLGKEKIDDYEILIDIVLETLKFSFHFVNDSWRASQSGILE